MTWSSRQEYSSPCQRTPRARSLEIAILLMCLGAISSPIALADADLARVVLVRGTVSTPNAGERAYAQRVTERLSSWLRDMGIQHSVLDDESITALTRAKHARVLILTYNPNLPEEELRILREFVGRGGKLIVFYSCDSRLASLMEMKMGKYMKASKRRQWHSFSFNNQAPDYLPRTVFQNSRNIRPVYPDGKSSRVIAYWEDASGTPLSDPAWVRSQHGFWMTHVLQDGGIENKKAMLLGLIGTYAPSVWRVAAERYVVSCGATTPFTSLEDARRRISRQVRGRPRAKEVQSLLSRAASVKNGLALLLEQEEYPEAIERAKGVDALVTRAYARGQEAQKDEFRGVWDHAGTGPYPGDWKRTCKFLADHGITAVFPNIIRNGIAHYKSRILARSDIYSQHGDQVQKCVNAAKKSGIQVHAWKICWRMDSAPRSVIAKLKRQKRLQADASGASVNWLCPSDKRNLEFELAAIKELAGYSIQGIHLDYNRYRDGRSCYCAGCKERFEKKIGQEVHSWPQGVRKAPLNKQYQAWRCEQTEQLMINAARIVRAADKDMLLSAAVFGGYPQCVAGVGQDWAKWLRDDHVDFVCPMNYTARSAEFSELLRKQVALPSAGGRIMPGIGVTATESQLTPAQTIEQILISREYGAAGYVLFQLGIALQRETLPIMRLGVSTPK